METLAHVEAAAPKALRPMVAEVCTYLLNCVYSGAPVQVWPLDGDVCSDGPWYVAPGNDGLIPLFRARSLTEAMVWCQAHNVSYNINPTPTTTLDNSRRWHRVYDSPVVWTPGQ